MFPQPRTLALLSSNSRLLVNKRLPTTISSRNVPKVSEMLQAFRSFIGENQMMAYLVMKAVRLNWGSMNAVEGCTA